MTFIENFSPKQKKFLIFLSATSIVWIILNSIIFGLGFAIMDNIQNSSSFGEYEPAIPSKVLDINGKLITEFISEENRKIIPLTDMPTHLLKSLLVREDFGFFSHHGFSTKNLVRAAFNILIGSYYSGGSTLTQQLSKHLYTDQAYRSARRKLQEVFFALQMEKKLSKQEILEQYLNKMYFGYGNYGVQTASQYYFSKDASNIDVAESVMLVIQLANPSLYTPLKFAERAGKMQREILNQMVSQHYIKEEEANSSYDEYWKNFDWSRSNVGAFFLREDKAPYFSEYLREEIPQYLSGNSNLYKDGFVIYSTLDLEAQEYAQSLVSEAVRKANLVVQQNNRNETSSIDSEIVPIIDMMADLFNLKSARVNGKHIRKESERKFYNQNIESLGLVSSLLGQSDAESAINFYSAKHQKDTSGEVVEGALIAIDHSEASRLGYIVSMVGGEGFTANNQFNRAMNAHVQAGSTFKPLFYAAALEKKKVTTGTLLLDSPIAFQVDQYSSLYTPNNFRGEFRGQVLLREALSFSLNIPSIKVLEALGFDDAIKYATRLLHVNDPNEIEREYPKSLPLALGTNSLAPVQLAIAYSVFANEGKDLLPISIRYIEDRNGSLISQPERETWDKLNSMGSHQQILSPQTAYLMTHILQTSVVSGYLRSAVAKAGGIDMTLAGKTGTTQNTSNGWAIGYSPYITAAVWFGFDKPGKSLGPTQTGGLLAGPVWAKYMKFYHRNLPNKDFVRPQGLINVSIQKETGLLPEGHPQEHLVNELFIEGTEPKKKSHFYTDLDSFYSSRLESLFVDNNTSHLEKSLDNLTLQLPPELRKNLSEKSNEIILSVPKTPLGEFGLQLPPDLLKSSESSSLKNKRDDALYILKGSKTEEESSSEALKSSAQSNRENTSSNSPPIPIDETFSLDE